MIDINAIKARLGSIPIDCVAELRHRSVIQSSLTEDMPALIAEIERLRASNADLATMLKEQAHDEDRLVEKLEAEVKRLRAENEKLQDERDELRTFISDISPAWLPTAFRDARHKILRSKEKSDV